MRAAPFIAIVVSALALGCGSETPAPTLPPDASLIPEQVVFQLHVENRSVFALEATAGDAIFEERSYSADEYLQLDTSFRVVHDATGTVISSALPYGPVCPTRGYAFAEEHDYVIVQPSGQIYYMGRYCHDETGRALEAIDPEPNQHCLTRDWIVCDEKCGVTTVLDEPLTQHIDCSPAGPKARGEACTKSPASEGGHDDCGPFHACIEGVCEKLCLGWRGSHQDCLELELECVPLEGFEWAGPVGVCR